MSIIKILRNILETLQNTENIFLKNTLKYMYIFWNILKYWKYLEIHGNTLNYFKINGNALIFLKILAMIENNLK